MANRTRLTIIHAPRRVKSALERDRMFVFISHLSLEPADLTVLEAHFKDRSRLVDGFDGFLYLQLLEPQSSESTLTFLTAWESREAFRRYMRSAEHAESHAREPAALMKRAQVKHQAFEVLMDSRSTPEWKGKR